MHSRRSLAKKGASLLRCAVVGASGYAGAELVTILASHPEIEIASLHADSHAGARFEDLFPRFRHFPRPDGRVRRRRAAQDRSSSSLPTGRLKAAGALAGKVGAVSIFRGPPTPRRRELPALVRVRARPPAPGAGGGRSRALRRRSSRYRARRVRGLLRDGGAVAAARPALTGETASGRRRRPLRHHRRGPRSRAQLLRDGGSLRLPHGSHQHAPRSRSACSLPGPVRVTFVHTSCRSPSSRPSSFATTASPTPQRSCALRAPMRVRPRPRGRPGTAPSVRAGRRGNGLLRRRAERGRERRQSRRRRRSRQPPKRSRRPGGPDRESRLRVSGDGGTAPGRTGDGGRSCLSFPRRAPRSPVPSRLPRRGSPRRAGGAAHRAVVDVDGLAVLQVAGRGEEDRADEEGHSDPGP